MKLAYHQLEQHLAKKLAPIYVVSGDEILLVDEACHLIRAAARKNGFNERVSITIEPGTDWGKLLYAEAHSFSLFSTKRIVELHLAAAKPNNEANKILKDIAANPLPDTILLICTNKLDSKTEQTSWFKALDKAGMTIPIWPIALEQLPAWILQRAKKLNLNLTNDAAKFLAEQVEGNLLAAAQEIEKLSLLSITTAIDLSTLQKIISDNAHFDIFSLVDCALSGNNKRCLRILDNLKAENTEPLLILWALTRELRTLADIAKQIKQGSQLPALFSKFRIWEKRQANFRRFLQHHTEEDCWKLLSQGAQIDRIIKGLKVGNVWDELQQLTLKISAIKVFESPYQSYL